MQGKLVRDRISDILKATGRTPAVRVLKRVKVLDALRYEVQEGCYELRSAPEESRLAKLADIHEVIYALSDKIGAEIDRLNRIADPKRDSRGDSPAICG